MAAVLASWRSGFIGLSPNSTFNTNMTSFEIINDESTIQNWFPHEGEQHTRWNIRIVRIDGGKLNVIFEGADEDMVSGFVFFDNSVTPSNFSVFTSNNTSIPSSVTDLSSLLRIDIQRSASGPYPALSISFKINKNYDEFGDAVIAEYSQSSRANSTSTQSNQVLRSNNLVPFSPCPKVQMMYQTDQYGLNLGEMNCIIISRKRYPGGYPQKLVGSCEGGVIPWESERTLFSKRPNLQRVLLLSGNTLFAQTTAINDQYLVNTSNCDFYNDILAYSTLKYFFAGLITKKFTTRWLLRKYNTSFISAMKKSEFSCFVSIFMEPRYRNLYKYYRINY